MAQPSPQSELVVVSDVAEEVTSMFLAAQPSTIVLTGGDTPRALYERLTGIEYDWTEVEFFLSDERCVPVEDDRSNARMCQDALVSRVGGQAYWMNGTECDAAGYEDLLHQRFRDRPRFDLAIYGLGPDGHTASLFPGRPEVEETDRWVVKVPKPGYEPFVPRLSLTVPVLSSARLGVFLVTGEEKREPLRRLLSGEDIPAARMAPERLVVVADHVAAA
jgi:6-phosphogluconolactonase